VFEIGIQSEVIFYVSVKDCKETWRNLRIVFARNLRKAPAGSRARKKKYYLLEKMQFLRPYLNIKVEKSLPVNQPSPTNIDHEQEPNELQSSALHEKTYNEEFNQNITYKEFNQQTDYEEADQHAASGKHRLIMDNEQSRRHSTECLKEEKKKKCDKLDVDQYVINYIKSKKASQLENYRRQFLVSLLPDVEEMDASQFRQFRKRVGNLIEEILEPNSSTPQTATTPTTWTNESSASSFGINI
jgi:hypothetical protein